MKQLSEKPKYDIEDGVVSNQKLSTGINDVDHENVNTLKHLPEDAKHLNQNQETLNSIEPVSDTIESPYDLETPHEGARVKVPRTVKDPAKNEVEIDEQTVEHHSESTKPSKDKHEVGSEPLHEQQNAFKASAKSSKEPLFQNEVFEDPINFQLLDESKVEKIIRRKVTDKERFTFIIYKADDFGQVKLEAYRQTLSDSGEVVLEFEEHQENIPELVTHQEVLDDIMKNFIDKRTLGEKIEYEDLTVESLSDTDTVAEPESHSNSDTIEDVEKISSDDDRGSILE